MIAVFLASLGALIPITNPIAAVAAFAGLTSGMPAKSVHRQAWATGAYVAGILAVFAVAGTFVLQAFGITLAALQIAGGLVVMFSGFQLLLHGPSTPAASSGSGAPKSVAFSPMALPLIAGPGAIGIVIGLTARNTAFLDRVGVVLAAVAIGAIIALTLRFGTPLVDRIGPAAIDALTRVMGFLILAIGAELVVHGALAAFPALAGTGG